ncbi:HAD-IA family hydrolase [Lacunimicrobium album]
MSPLPTILPHVRWVVFDAVGTLIAPEPSVADAYHEIAAQFGSLLTRDEIQQRFKTVYNRLMTSESRDLATSEDIEHRYWQELVAEVLDDVRDRLGCFDTLWKHFSQPTSWKLIDRRGELLKDLKQAGHNLGMASNFDGRLRAIVDGMPELRQIDQLWISSEVGWKKPAPAFYETIIKDTGVRPDQILFIGDEPLNDVEAPRRHGMHALHVDDLT